MGEPRSTDPVWSRNSAERETGRFYIARRHVDSCRFAAAPATINGYRPCSTLGRSSSARWPAGSLANKMLRSILREENRVLKQQLGRKRLRLTDDQRRRLAVRGKAIGRRALAEIASKVTPHTILRWHRQLIAEKWTHKRRSPGRPRIMQVIAELTVRMARENPRWGYSRIQGALYNVGHRVGRTTVADILRRNGIDPAPERGKRTTWSPFLAAHRDVLAATDFLTVEVWGLRGLVTFYVFFVIELATRRVEFAGITLRANIRETVPSLRLV